MTGARPLRVVVHGETASAFAAGLRERLGNAAEVFRLPDRLVTPDDRLGYAAAEIIVGFGYGSAEPVPAALRLFHLVGAGYDAVDFALLPATAAVCNCYGHEQPIAEYVMAALLHQVVPLAEADRLLRVGDWRWRGGGSGLLHGELAGRAVGLLGFGRIGQAVAARAKAFEMQVHVANRTPVATSVLVDRAWGMADLPSFLSGLDFLVASLPLTEETRGLLDASALSALPRHAVVVNVGRGPTIDEAAFYAALRDGRLAGAVIDTWYAYPGPGETGTMPSALPFHALPNVVMTPHMAGWTPGLMRRRLETIAGNIERLLAGRPLVNEVRAAVR